MRTISECHGHKEDIENYPSSEWEKSYMAIRGLLALFQGPALTFNFFLKARVLGKNMNPRLHPLSYAIIILERYQVLLVEEIRAGVN